MMQTQNKLIHIGLFHPPGGGIRYTYLRKLADFHYMWFEGNEETESGLTAPHVEEAIRLAHRKWKMNGFRLLHCGFRYALPERDEHGINALFCQMGASYDSMNGVYFEEELGYNCHVQNASEEALTLWRALKAKGKV